MLTPARPSMLQLGDTHIHWVELGQGRPLVLLHGLGDCHQTWARVAPQLAQNHRVLLPDLLGHGLSGRPDASYSLQWHTQLVGAWINALGLDDMDLVGHSFGGGVAQSLLLDFGTRIRHLALVAPGGLGIETSLGLRLCAATQAMERFGQPWMGLGTRWSLRLLGGIFDKHEIELLSWMNQQPGTARAMARTTRDVIDFRGQSKHFWDYAHQLVELPPLALYWGDKDPVIPIQHAEAFISAVEGVKLTCFKGCGHFVHRQQPAEFSRSLEAFLDRAKRPVRLSRSRISLYMPRKPSLWRRMWTSVRKAVKRCKQGLRR